MENIKKHLASVFVFFINLVLVGVGFLFIKNADEAKKQKENNNLDFQASENITTGDGVALENILEGSAANEPAVSDSVQNIVPDNSPAVPSLPQASKKSSSSNSSNNNSSSSSSGTTKTS